MTYSIDYKEMLGCEEVRSYPEDHKRIRACWVPALKIKMLIDKGANVCYENGAIKVGFPDDEYHYFRVIPCGANMNTVFWGCLKDQVMA